MIASLETSLQQQKVKWEMTRAESSSFCRSTVTTLLFIPEECVGLPWGPVTREGEGERREDQRQRGKAIAGRHLKPRQRQGPPASL